MNCVSCKLLHSGKVQGVMCSNSHKVCISSLMINFVQKKYECPICSEPYEFMEEAIIKRQNMEAKWIELRKDAEEKADLERKECFERIEAECRRIMNDYQNLLRVNDELTCANDILTKECKELINENQSQSAVIHQLHSNQEIIRRGMGGNMNGGNMSGKYKQLEDENKSLIDKVSLLEIQNQAINKMRENMYAPTPITESDNYKAKIEVLSDEIKELTTRNNALNGILRSHKSENIRLNEIIKKLENRDDVLTDGENRDDAPTNGEIEGDDTWGDLEEEE
jgi:hypothetical protein